jgi:hypothetical protein
MLITARLLPLFSALFPHFLDQEQSQAVGKVISQAKACGCQTRRA